MSDDLIPYKLSFESRQGYLYAHIKATIMNHDTALAYMGEVADKCRAENFTRLLLHRDIGYMMSPSDVFFVMQKLAGIMAGIKVAFVLDQMIEPQVIDFGLLVARNRGAHFSLKESEAAAEQWLMDAAIR